MSDEAPYASVVIPAWHSRELIPRCLQALRAQHFTDFEAIVVNSSPEDGTSEYVAGSFPEVTLVQSESRLLPHAARNRGVGHARGRLIVFTDPDCVPRPDWLERLIAAHLEGSPVVAGSMGLLGDSRREQGVHLCKFSWALPGLPEGTHQVAPTANVAYSRESWQELGPFEGEEFCGDAVLSWRAAAMGMTPHFVPAARVDHHHGVGPRQLWRQRHQRGREFARRRMRFEGWSRPRAAVHALSWPALAGLCLVRSGRDAAAAGCLGAFAASIPLQAAGQLAWCSGEAREQGRRALMTKGGRPR